MKLSGGFGIVLIALIIAGVIGFIRISGVQKVVANLFETHIPLLQVISAIDVSAAEQEFVITQYAFHKNKGLLSRFRELDQRVDDGFEEAKKLVKTDQKLVEKGWLESVEKMEIQHDVFGKACETLINALKADKPSEGWGLLIDEVAKQSAMLMNRIDDFLNLNDRESNDIAALALDTAQFARLNIGIIGIMALVTSILLACVITRGITKPINRVIEGLNEGADQVASASGQVSSASQSLAEGSSEQAASIEEISSSLEEMSSITKQNAEHAHHADNLMKEANQVVDKANQSMMELTGSMKEISKASHETSKIIKTIDEIAFQTNLLALNAAVEAARAGEAGAGFAVVADEVRNLAMRAAEAAKNTAALIEGTVKKIDDGGEQVARTNEAFNQVAESASKVDELVTEIAAASKEQAQGIEQINTAVAEMDKVIQQNAANAEESASISEEMNAHAEQMKAIVEELVALVGGNPNGAECDASATIKASQAQFHSELAVPAKQIKKLPVHKANKVSPEQIIPMDEDNFKDF
ncbi:MAG: methyl-accepting chemotaxis protein [Desulfobacterales bacterium]